MTYSKIDLFILEELYGVIPDKKRVLTDEMDILSYASDASFGCFKPEAVLQPLETQEISRIAILANKYKNPYISQKTIH
ncbi:hypothetical protein GCM10009865_29140 [Aeromicrobium ponti]|uniref:Glycolate oxidase/D-lactate dehydrogenase n=1 Tax=Cytobacillus oceanisediminis TaxID=665099 RepID=A0A562JRT4_9BACI|nr:glycolate oxidase/D-lactate dehydrogenase [Cytobacillus oceanisediminis]